MLLPTSSKGRDGIAKCADFVLMVVENVYPGLNVVAAPSSCRPAERRSSAPVLIQQTLRLLNPEFRTSLPHKDCMTNEPYGTRADSCSIAPEPSRAICSALFVVRGLRSLSIRKSQKSSE